jgi:acyl transferase domain-containing protein
MGDPGNGVIVASSFAPDKHLEITTPLIAIVGIGLRLPGGIHSTEALWELLINKKTTRGVVPSDRYNIESFYSAKKKPGTVAMQHGHFLAESDHLDHLDTSLFSMSKGEVEQLDPQQRMLLEGLYLETFFALF